MTELLFILALGGMLVALFVWAFRVLPREEWQVLAAVPRQREEPGKWRSVNLTYYGFFMATACSAAMALSLVLLASIGVPTWATALLVAVTVGACLVAANVFARLVEGNRGALSIAGAFFVACLFVPPLVTALNCTLGAIGGFDIPWLPALAVCAISYALGEGIGRLACISFGCCYGRPLACCPAWIHRLFSARSVAFFGSIKKAVYEGGYEGVPLVPVQALTAVCSASTALAGIWLFLHNATATALLTTIGVTQLWRCVSEFLRADYRGPGRISVYQVTSLAAIPLTAGLVALAGDDPAIEPDIVAGLQSLYDATALLSLQSLWGIVFLWMGRSWVTDSIVQFRLRTETTVVSPKLGVVSQQSTNCCD